MPANDRRATRTAPSAPPVVRSPPGAPFSRERRRYSDPSLRRLIDQLVAARHRAGMTQVELARRLCTQKSAISRLEGDFQHRPTLTTLENYALVVGCRLDIEVKRWP